MSHGARHNPPLPTPFLDDGLARRVDVLLHRQQTYDEGLQLVVAEVGVEVADLEPLHPRPLRRHRAAVGVDVLVHQRRELGPGKGARGLDGRVVDGEAGHRLVQAVGAGVVDAIGLDVELSGPVVGLEADEEAVELGAEGLELGGCVGRDYGTGDGGDELLDGGLRGGGSVACHCC